MTDSIAPTCRLYDLDRDLTMTLAEWCEEQGVKQVIERYGSWVVTPYGLECLTSFYDISAGWLLNRPEELESHMFAKRWVNREDFHAALLAAQAYHRPRFRPALRRDGSVVFVEAAQ